MNSPNPPIPILLLKSPSSSLPDTYSTIFLSPQYQTHHIPLLITTSLLTPLIAFLSSFPSYSSSNAPLSAISALVFTSQRAVNSFSSLLSSSSSSHQTTAPGPPSTSTLLLTPSQLLHLRALRIPLFAVGLATGNAIQKNLIDDAGGGFMPECWVEGSEAGNGEELARMILVYFQSWPLRLGRKKVSIPNGDGDGDEGGSGGGANMNAKVLFLTGERRRDVVPRVLRDGGVEVEEVVVYGTQVDDGFEAEFGRVVRATEESGLRWVVVFSGQGAKEMLKGLGWLHDGIKGESGKVKERDGCGGKDGSRRRTFVASIGRTTANYLETELGFKVDVCAEKPTPDALKEGIDHFMKEYHEGCQ